jgi:integrase
MEGMAHHGCSDIPRKLCTFQVFRRTLGTDLQKHGTMKDAQTILRHKHIKTTAEVYMDRIPDSVSRAIEARTDAIFALRNKRLRRKSTGVLLNIAGQSKGKVSVN